MIDKLLQQEIEEQTSDKEVAVLLSGGVDSLSVAFAAQRLGKTINAYTFHLKGQPTYDSIKAQQISIKNNWYCRVIEVPTDNLIGNEGQGWNIAMATAGFERGLMLRSPARFQETAANLIKLASNYDNLAPSINAALIDCWVRAEAYALNIYQTASKIQAGKKIGPESSLGKIFWSNLDLEMHAVALKILGTQSELKNEEAKNISSWIKGFMFSLAGPIYAGTNEIQKNIVAERLLGLPR